jgi:hypothetical protein
MSDYIPKILRTAVVERAKGSCEYCLSQATFATQSFAIDHIYPVSLGGMTALDNLALSCPGCNGFKSNKLEAIDPVTRQAVALFHPRQYAWDEHFCWSKDFLLVIGLTAIGRATVEALRLNRQPLINLRRALYGIGEHPPARMG